MTSVRTLLATGIVTATLVVVTVGTGTSSAVTAKVKCPAARVNINTATSAQLMTVPGVTKKWAKEIQEYRPYSNFAELEQNLTKYFPLKAVKALEPCFSLK